MKPKAVEFFHCVAIAQAVTIGTLLLGGCSSTEILKPRPGIPPPITAPPPPPEAVQIPSSKPSSTVGAQAPDSKQGVELVISGPGKGAAPASTPTPSSTVPVYEKNVPVLEIIDFEPAGKGSSKGSGITALPMPPQIESKHLTHKVARGESLWTVARMYGVSTAELASLNNMDAKASVKTGTELTLPPGAKFVPTEERPAIKVNAPKSKTSKTSEATSSSSKSKTERITVPDHVSAPKADPASASKTERVAAPGEYAVKNGDNLWSIARKFDLHVSEIAELNNLDPTKPLKNNQVIRLPQGSSAKTASATSAPHASPDKPQKTDKTADKSADKSKTSKPTTSESTSSSKKSSGNNVNGAEKPAAAPAAVNPENEKKDPLLDAFDAADDGDDAADAARPPPPEAEMLTHAVRDGDTWESISSMYGVKVEDLKKNNPNGLKPGSTVKFPK